MAYENVAGIRNEIINEPLSEPLVDNTTGSIFIFGTAKKGPMYKPTKIEPGTIEEIFGNFTQTQFSDRSLVKAYYEALAAGSGDPSFNIRLIRVGKTSKPKLELYEWQGGEGAHAPTEGAISLRLEYETPNTRGNLASATVTGSGIYPTALNINLPSGITKSFYMDPTGLLDGYINNVYDLIEAISDDDDIAKEGILASTNLIEKSYEFDYSQPQVELGIVEGDPTTMSNNLVDISEAKSFTTAEDILQMGSSTGVLSEVPDKVQAPGTPTIKEFWAVIGNASITIQDVTLIGTNTFQLNCASNSNWLSGANSIDELEVIVKRGSEDIEVTVANIDYSTGDVTLELSGGFTGGFDVGDEIIYSYEYKLLFMEAKVKSQLEVGNQYSYFVSGDSIIFGANLSRDVKLIYDATKTYEWGVDIISNDPDNSVIIFSNPSNRPNDGDRTVIIVRFLPELPAVTGDIKDKDGVSIGVIQPSGFTGGRDGENMTTSDYRTEVKKAFELTFGHPCASIIVAGSYLDDAKTGFNPETGMKEIQTVDWHSLIVDHVMKKTQYVNECNAYIGLRPMDDTEPETIEKYINDLITLNPSDPTTPANIVSLMDAYPLVVVANDFVVAVPKVVPDAVYATNPCVIYAVTRQLQDKSTSPIMLANKMPACVRSLRISSVGWDKLDAINRMRFTFFIRDITGGTMNIIPADAPTMAPFGSDLDRQYVLDIVYEALRDVRASLQNFIGKKSSERTRAVMSNVAKSVLKEKTPEKLTAFDVKIYVQGHDRIDGNTRIQLLLVTSREIRKVTISTRLKIQ